MKSIIRGSLKDILIYKGLLYSVSIYLIGILVSVIVLYAKLSNDFNSINQSFIYQTSLAVLPDMQDGNYYGVKHSLEQIAKSENISAIAVIGNKGQIYARSGIWKEEQLDNTKSLEFPPANSSSVHKLQNGMLIVRGLYDQNGVMWGKLVALVNQSWFFSIVRNMAVLLLMIMFVVIGTHAIVSCVIIKKSIKPLIGFTGEINQIARQIDGVETNLRNWEVSPPDLNRFISTLKNYSGTVNEIDNLLASFSRLLMKLGHFWNAYLDNTHLAAIGQSSAMIAHDVRKPLSSIKALLVALPHLKNNDSQLKKMITAVDRNISHTNAMLNEVLDFSRDATVLELKEHGLQGIILSAVTDAVRNHDGADIDIEYLFGHENRTIYVDGPRIIRVLTNIVDNALDVMTPTDQGLLKGKIVFSTRLVDKGGRKNIVISVRDCGPGIPDDLLLRIFDPFFTKGKSGGTGLGLAICKRVIDMHGGYIEARNVEGGAELFVELAAGSGISSINESELIHNSKELRKFKEEADERVDYGDTSNTAEFMRLHKARGRAVCLLMVDDEPLFRETVRSLLNTIPQVCDHVRVVEAESAETALELFKTGHFDYVIADIDMGKNRMNGYEMSRMILDKYPNTHVLIHSNKRREEMDKNIRQINSLRFMGFLPKPMKQSELLQFLACKTFEAKKTEISDRQIDKRKILVVNDDEALLMTFKMILKSPSHKIFTAATYGEAVEKYAEEKVDIILSDVNLGHGVPSGYEFLKYVRERNKKIPFYMVSGYSAAEEEPKAVANGASGYLQLPLEDGALSGILGSA